MENEQVFKADETLQAQSNIRLRPSHLGHDIVKMTAGGIERQNNHYNEATPLLVGGDGESDPSFDEFGDGNERAVQYWSGDKDFDGRPWWNKPSVFWLLPGFLLYTLSFGGVIVPRLNLILGLICKQYFSDRSTNDPHFRSSPLTLGGDVNPHCQIPEVQALVSNFSLYANLIAGILSAFTSLMFGSLSDRYGRTKIMAFSMLGMLINEVGFILAATYPETIPVQWVLLGSVFEGICGSFTTTMALTFAYGSDCTQPSKRNVIFGYFHGALFSGIGLGPIVAGYIVKITGKTITIFYISLACHSAFLLALLILIPESLSTDRQLAARARKAEKAEKDAKNHVIKSWPDITISYLRGSNFLAPLSILFPRGEGSNGPLRWNLVLLAAVDTTMFGVAMGSISVVILYSEYMFHWATFESTVFVSTVNSCRVIVLLVILPLMTRIFRGPKRLAILQNSGSDLIDLSFIRVAIFFDLVGFIGYSTVRSGPLFILSGCIASFGGIGSPTLQAAITKHVPEDRTGQVLGAMGLLHALARVVAPTIFNVIYSLTVAKCPQTVFLCLASAFALAFVLSWFIRPHVHWDAPEGSKLRPAESAAGENQYGEE